MFWYALGAYEVFPQSIDPRMPSLYLLVNFCSVIVPFLFSFHPKLRFDKEFRYFFPANALVAIIFIIWDVIFTGDGVWGFNPDYLLGIYFFHLPLEEILFFICIPFACLFTYHCLNIFFKIKWSEKLERLVVIGLSTILLAIGILFLPRAYTSVTFISLALVLLALKFLLRVNWLPKIFTIYLVLLLPFFIVNGILTGTGLESPIVWYNNQENLGIRMLTIPVEDTFYGFELVVLNLFFYERLKGRKNASKDA